MGCPLCRNLARFELWNGAELLQRFFPNNCRGLRVFVVLGAGSHVFCVAATWEMVDADYWLSYIMILWKSMRYTNHHHYHSMTTIILWKHPVQEPCQVNLVFRSLNWQDQVPHGTFQGSLGSLPWSFTLIPCSDFPLLIKRCLTVFLTFQITKYSHQQFYVLKCILGFCEAPHNSDFEFPQKVLFSSAPEVAELGDEALCLQGQNLRSCLVGCEVGDDSHKINQNGRWSYGTWCKRL